MIRREKQMIRRENTTIRRMVATGTAACYISPSAEIPDGGQK